jgi:hypothetical protein
MSNVISDLCQSLKNLWGNARPVLRIGLPIGLSDRSTGRLFIKDHKGRILLDNIPLRTYGITPIGRYTVMGIRISGSGTPYPVEVYGSEGIVMIEAPQGYLTLQGGRGTQGNDLLATKGGFRVSDSDMRSIIIALETIEGPIDCHCVPLNRNGNSEEWDEQDDQYDGSLSIGESSGDSEFLPELMDEQGEEVPIEEWSQPTMSDDGYC